jgi:hypothetical protein
MILNSEMISNKKKFNKKVAFWLMYEKHIPLLSMDSTGEIYWFAKTELLEQAEREMPLLLKLFGGYW